MPFRTNTNDFFCRILNYRPIAPKFATITTLRRLLGILIWFRSFWLPTTLLSDCWLEELVVFPRLPKLPVPLSSISWIFSTFSWNIKTYFLLTPCTADGRLETPPTVYLTPDPDALQNSSNLIRISEGNLARNYSFPSQLSRHTNTIVIVNLAPNWQSRHTGVSGINNLLKWICQETIMSIPPKPI